MSEHIDVLTEVGLRTGETLTRAEIHRRGAYHRAVHVLLVDQSDRVVLQRRGPNVDHYPNALSMSVTAHVQAGEYSSACARREIEEELALDPANLSLNFLFSFYQEATLSPNYIDRQFIDVYVGRGDIMVERIKIDRTEVSEVAMVPINDFIRMASDRESGLASVYGNEIHDLAFFVARLQGPATSRP